jgi:hypothetical protein
VSNVQQAAQCAPDITLMATSSESMHGYAVHTRAQHEKKVAVHLQEKDITTFLPLITKIHRWSDRRKKAQVSLFPCYTFVHPCKPHSQSCFALTQRELRNRVLPGLAWDLSLAGTGMDVDKP